MTEVQLAYNLLRASLDGSVPYLGTTPPEATRWWSLFRLIQRNHLVALTSGTVAALDMPRAVKIPWLAEADKAERWHCYQMEVQQDIVDTMAKHGIDTLVLKGTHTAQHYPQPDQREFGDLDLYFYDRHDEADRVAREVLKVEISNDSHHHTKYNYRGVTVESHYDFLNVHYPPSNRRYEKMLKAAAPSPTFEVLFLLRHMAGHFAASRITLRDLADWTLTCRALEAQVDWTAVQDTVEQYGMTSFVYAMNSIAEKQLGYRPPIDLHGSRDDLETVGRLERDIVYGSTNTDDTGADGMARLTWKMRRWRANRWKRCMAFSDSETSLLLASLTSHTAKPRSILHKM